MGKLIMRITDDRDNIDYYFEWSTMVDAPVTYGMSLENFKRYYETEYGRSSLIDLESRLKRVELTGCSSLIGETFDNCLRLAQANGSKFTKIDILDTFRIHLKDKK